MTVVVVGPPGAGKSTAAAGLAARRGLPVVSFDADPARWYRPFGYTDARADHWFGAGGVRAWHRYTAQFDVRALHRLVSAGTAAVVDTGGGVALQERPSGAALLADAITLADEVVLVCPHPDDEPRAYAVLADRLGRRADAGDATWTGPAGRALLTELVAASLRLRPHAHLVLDTATERGAHRA